MPLCIFYPLGVKESFKKSRPLISFPTFLINRLGWVLFILYMIRFLIPNTVYRFFFGVYNDQDKRLSDNLDG